MNMRRRSSSVPWTTTRSNWGYSERYKKIIKIDKAVTLKFSGKRHDLTF
jgi:hypothetical protein